MTTSEGLRPQLRRYIGCVLALACPLLLAAFVAIALHPPSLSAAFAIVLFSLLSLIADLQPVAMEDGGGSEVSVANIFIVAVAILFGWQYAVPMAAMSVGVSFAAARQPVARTIFNTSMYALSAFAAAAPVLVLGHPKESETARLTGYVLVGSVVHLMVNVRSSPARSRLPRRSPTARWSCRGCATAAPPGRSWRSSRRLRPTSGRSTHGCSCCSRGRCSR